MFLGSVIYDKRRSLNLTQNDLANGVCNQNTISKMEKHSMTPQIDVLIKICQRLDLSLNDVFSDFSSDTKNEQVFVLDSIEEDVLLNELDEVNEKLSLIKNNVDAKDNVQYDFIKGALEFQKGNLEVSSFNLDKVLQGTKSDNTNIYTLISYLIKGMIYQKQDHADIADYYCNLIAQSLKENLNIANASGVEMLYLCNSLGQLYLNLKQYSNAESISKRGIEYANENHLSYFIDELSYLVALSNKQDQGNKKEFEKYKDISYYTAELLNNKKLQNKLQKD
ncbi:transcriptional regulator [Companilactobacillus crustorum]|uniref:HTH cro/C1-type domain-containing protein n=3 Tax=Companilactobacillus TaxID=2767879 RepID=A0A837RIY1_9LACO|nr:helix-turn-helix transcriptional regulator [Companilactobacillus crustorum]HCD06685.1 XRE family transcriptional regulator [Lactobacillus sp.]APU71907.1 hypothetical protein BI355_1602 [Companilactobacillus crustorum]KRK42687.1 hypothetical protein FD26_GL000426 [Companilactobacillus crustorum JCM 15951]KRO21293.1 hypothetical protein IV63_GL001752 [Companilactobacillus crustorum]WDT66008.1 helix-turn-helix transcriptional regulator [Companilactobacillus crustorum]